MSDTYSLGFPGRLEVRSDMLDLEGATAGNIRFDREIGRGGVGRVFLGHNVALDVPVAIKVLDPRLAEDNVQSRRFLEEARTLARMRHPNIVTVHDVGRLGDHLYIVMDYIEGVPLSHILSQEAPLPFSQVMSIVTQVARALDAAHSVGIVHRDIKPANVIMDVDGRAVLTDFGLARAEATPRLTQTGDILGTPAYLSPEQVSDATRVGPASDIYSLAVMTFEMLTGVSPYEADSLLACLRAHTSESPRSLRAANPSTDYPESVESALRCALAKEPAGRFASASAFAQALDPTSQSVAAPGTEEASANPEEHPIGRRQTHATDSSQIVAALALAVLVAVAVTSIVRSNRSVAPQHNPGASDARHSDQDGAQSSPSFQKPSVAIDAQAEAYESLIAYEALVEVGDEDEFDWQIWTIRPDGSDRRLLVREDATVLDSPSWGPEAREVTYRACVSIERGGSGPRCRLEASSIQGSERRTLLARDAMNEPILAPDGLQVAISEYRTELIDESHRLGHSDLVVIGIDGSSPSTLAPSIKNESWPAWSPDSAMIAFTSNRLEQSQFGDEATLYDIFVVDVGGGVPQLLVDNPGMDRFSAWSPDGAWIAFLSDADCGLGFGNDLYVTEVDGGETRRLTTTCDVWGRMSWSPDGTRIVFGMDDDIYVMRFHGKGLTENLTNTPNIIERFPAWSPPLDSRNHRE